MKKLLLLLALTTTSNAQDYNEKLRAYGIPSHIRTGFDNAAQLRQEIRGEYQAEDGPVNLLQAARELDLTVTPTVEEDALGRIQHLLPVTIRQYIPAQYILMAQLSNQDGPYFQAFKLEKLGLIIKDIPSQHLSIEAQNLRKVLMAHCFLYAGQKLEKALDRQVEQTTQVAPELLMDGYMSAGQFYYWAAVNMNAQAGEIAFNFARRSFGKTQMAIATIPPENYDWDVIQGRSLAEVIMINQQKIHEILG